MARPRSPHPTELELQIIKIIWRDGPSNVRHVRDELSGWRDLAYTSVMTIMNIMADKGYLTRAKQEGGYVYKPKVSEQATCRRMLRDLVERAFDGSAGDLMLSLLETSDLDPAELTRLRALINQKLKPELKPDVKENKP